MTLVRIGIILIILGIIFHVGNMGSRHLSLGRLPGDIVIERENFKFYFPIISCLLVSFIISMISLIFYFFRK